MTVKKNTRFGGGMKRKNGSLSHINDKNCVYCAKRKKGPENMGSSKESVGSVNPSKKKTWHNW